MSVALLRKGMSNQKIGLNIIESSIYAPLPREFFPNKPMPGSAHGDKASMAIYIVQNDLRNEHWSISRFFTSTHAYWEFGIIGMILATIFASFFVAQLVLFILIVKVIYLLFGLKKVRYA